MAVEANEALVAVLAFVANDADVAILAVDAFCTLFVTRENVLPSPLVYVVVAFDIDAVVTNEPVLIGVTFNANDAVVAHEADVANDADVAILAVDAFCTLLTVTTSVVPSPWLKVIVALLSDELT